MKKLIDEIVDKAIKKAKEEKKILEPKDNRKTPRF